MLDTINPESHLPRGVLAGHDLAVWTWAAKEFGLYQIFINRAFGLIENGTLVGVALFHNFNGVNVEFSYYGSGHMSRGLIKYFASVALKAFNAGRGTVHCRRSNKRLIKFLLALGARHEATLWDYYGRDGKSRNAACQFVLTRERLEHLAG